MVMAILVYYHFTAKALAAFLEETQTVESILLQRLKDIEAKEILATISGTPQQDASDTSQSQTVTPTRAEGQASTAVDNPQQTSQPEKIEPYKEFW